MSQAITQDHITRPGQILPAPRWREAPSVPAALFVWMRDEKTCDFNLVSGCQPAGYELTGDRGAFIKVRKDIKPARRRIAPSPSPADATLLAPSSIIRSIETMPGP